MSLSVKQSRRGGEPVLESGRLGGSSSDLTSDLASSDKPGSDDEACDNDEASEPLCRGTWAAGETVWRCGRGASPRNGGGSLGGTIPRRRERPNDARRECAPRGLSLALVDSVVVLVEESTLVAGNTATAVAERPGGSN